MDDESLQLKIAIEVDDEEYQTLLKEIKKNKKEFIKIKPISEDEKINSYNDNVLNLKLEQLNNIVNKINNKSLLKSENGEDQLKKLIELEKKEVDLTEKSIDLISNKNKSSPEGESSSLLAAGGPAAIIALIGAALLKGSEFVQNKYTEKINRELDLANLSFETGETTDSLAKLSYQAKNVGLSLQQVVQSAANFADELSGTNLSDEKAQLYQALGIDVRREFSQAKTAEDFARIQLRVFNQARQGLLNAGQGDFISNIRASKLTGIPLNQAFEYENLNSKRNIDSAEKIKSARGNIGSKEDILENYTKLNEASQRSQASIDAVLSTEAVKNFVIKTAEMKADVINLIGNIVTGRNANSTPLPPPPPTGQGVYNTFYPTYGATFPSQSSQTKAGAQ